MKRFQASFSLSCYSKYLSITGINYLEWEFNPENALKYKFF